MRLYLPAVRKLLAERGWSEVRFARQLGIDYTYLYRVLREQRGMGKKFITCLINFCDREGLDFKEYVVLHEKE